MPLIQTPSIASVVEDQAPQLGGSLSTNGSNINVESGDVFYVHNLGTEGDSNYERLEVKWDTNEAVLTTTSAGTGAGRGMKLQNSGGNFTIDAASSISIEAVGAVTIEAYNAIYQQFTATGVGYRKDCYPIFDSSLDLGTTSLRWANTYTDTITIGNGVDAILTADAADTLALRNSTTAQQFNVYNTYTDASNYERLEVKWDANVATIDSTAAGTGTSRELRVGNAGDGNYVRFLTGTSWRGFAGSAEVFKVDAAAFEVSRKIAAGSDSSLDIGSSALRFKNTYTDTITIGNGVDAVLTADADNELALRNSTTAQAFNIYNTYTDASNYERLEVKWDANVAKIEPTAAGTGTLRGLYMGSTGTLTQIYGAAVRLYDGSSLMINIDSSDVTIYGNGIRPHNTGGINSGQDTRRWATTYTDGFATNVETFTAASDTLDAENNVCLCDCSSNAITLALPAPVSGLQFHIKKIDSTANTVSIEPDDPGPELIDGAVQAVISTQYDSITVVSDGSNWFII